MSPADAALAEALSTETPSAVADRVRALLSAGADPNADVDGCTALHRAVALLRGEAVALLLAAGGDLERPASDRVHVGPDTFVSRRSTPREILHETLRAQVRSGDVAYEDVRASYDAIAAAMGTTFDGLVAEAKKKPKAKKAARATRGESPIGRWTAVTFLYERSPDGETPYFPRATKCGVDTWDVLLADDGTFDSRGPFGLRADGRFEREGAAVRFDGLAARYLAATDTLEVTRTDDEHGSDVVWSFVRVA